MNCNQNTKALIYNDYLSFLLYQEGQNLTRIAISCPELSPCLWSYHKNIVGVGSPPPEGCPQGGVDKPILTHINNTPIKRNFVENLPHNPDLNQLARDKRKAGILSEVLFWQQVHQKKFHGIDFDRQRIIGNYIVDFYIKTLGLVVEIDGCSHDKKVEYDAKRQRYLESCGLRVYRIKDYDVKHNLDMVMLGLERFIVGEYGESTPVCGYTQVKSTTPACGYTGEESTTPACGHPSRGGESIPACGCSCEDKEFSEIEILDYLYAVLHKPAYLERFKESLEINSLRVPFPVDAKTFWHLVDLGREIRKINLFENPRIESYVLQYPFRGDSIIDTIIDSLDANEETQTSLTNSPPEQSAISHSKSEITRSQIVITNSPPPEGCPKGGVVNSKSLDYPENCPNKNNSVSNSRYSSNIPEFLHNLYIAGNQPSQKWFKDHYCNSLNFKISTLRYTPKINQ